MNLAVIVDFSFNFSREYVETNIKAKQICHSFTSLDYIQIKILNTYVQKEFGFHRRH